MNKRVVLFLLLLFIVCNSQIQAQPLSDAQAVLRVREFLKQNNKEEKQLFNRRQPLEPMQLLAKKRGLYVFSLSSDGGFVIAPSDARACPVLALVSSSNFHNDSLPAGMNDVLDFYSDLMENLPDVDTVENVVFTHNNPNLQTIEPLVKSCWGQDEPFNMLCPEVEGKRCVTGCVATAIAQILHYYRQPVSAKATFTYRTKTHNMKMQALPATTFNHDLMPEKFDNETPQECCEEVSKLMLYCGCAFSMDYSPSSSGADITPVCDGVPYFFGYDDSMELVKRADYDDGSWEQLIYDQIAEGYPVMYSGRTLSDDGHSFICDGYKDGFFHVNWGWKGYCDGWFRLSLLNPEYENANGYSIGHCAVINFKPMGWINDTKIWSTSINDTFIHQVYDIFGHHIKQPMRGFNIVKLSNGKTCKMMIP